MGERYWISGVQLGMLIAANNNGKEDVIDQVLKTIENEQFIGNTKPYPEVEKSEDEDERQAQLLEAHRIRGAHP